MPTELEELVLEELSLVDKGANQYAKVSIFKADTSKGDNMEDTDKMSEEMEAKVKAYMKEKGCDRKTAMNALMKSLEEVDTLKSDNERLRKALIDNGYVIKADTIEKKAEPEGITYDGEFVAKSDDRYELVKKLQEYEVEKVQAALEKRAAEELPNHEVKVAVTLLKAVEGSDNQEEAMKALKSADALLGKAMEEVGETSHEADMTDPTEKLNKMAKSYAAEKGVTFEKGYAAVALTEEGKALLKASKEKE